MTKLLPLMLLALLALGAAALIHDGSAKASPGAQSRSLPSQDGSQPQTMEAFLTGVTKDVDAYWTKEFKDSKLPEPKVKYAWIPEGYTAASACGDEDGGSMGDSAAAYCPGDDTVYIALHHQTLAYAMKRDFDIQVSPENQVHMKFIAAKP